MIETQIGLLNETISNLAKKFEEEKREWEGASAGKDAEIANLRRELEENLGQLHIVHERNAQLEAQLNGMNARIEEIEKAQRQEIENREIQRQNELEKEKELIEATIRSMDQMMMEERSKWREALRSN